MLEYNLPANRQEDANSARSENSENSGKDLRFDVGSLNVLDFSPKAGADLKFDRSCDEIKDCCRLDFSNTDCLR